MKKLTSTMAAGVAGDPRTLARVILAFVASVLAVLLALMGMASGPNGALVFAQESPSESPAPSGPSIKLINPSLAYNPGYPLPARPPGSQDPPNISDKKDGADELYHVVALSNDAPANAAVEAYFQPNVGLEITVGIMDRVAGTDDTWELFWDIPDSMSATSGTFKVIMFESTITGFQEVASDETPARVDRNEETIEMSWPSQNGELGFHKPKGGSWTTVVEGTASSGTQRVAIWYSTSEPGADVEYTRCASDKALGGTVDGVKPWRVSCALSGKALPSQVTSIAALAVQDDKPIGATTAEFTQESADAHRVQPYVQMVDQMKLELTGVGGGNSAQYPSSQRRQAMPPQSTSDPFPISCLTFDALVTDHLDRPVQGANVDVHMQGPNDQAGFGADWTSGNSSSDSNYKSPDKADHSKEDARYCWYDEETVGDSRGDPPPSGDTQGEHNVPGNADIKHIESSRGTGLDPASSSTAFKFGPGIFRFHVFSFTGGFSNITAWVDDQPIATESATREADDDALATAEANDDIRGQWLPQPASVSIMPRTDSASVGECNRYTVRARAGQAVLPGINVDVHATGPNNDLDFCDPGDGTPRRAPEKPEGDNAHQPEDDGEASHKSDSPDNPETQHTEGETDDDGNFVFGITSAATGSTQITAWIDGERGEDNDVQASGEPSGSASKSWAATAADAEVRFVNPSGYGNSGDRIARTRDADERYHLVARVDLPDVVPGVEFFLGEGETFTKIGDGVRVADSDTWEFFWDVSVPDGNYTLRAQIIGTQKREDRSVTVRNQSSGTDPRIVTFQTAELTRPLNAGAAPFENSATPVEGVASAGARGVEFYYTKTAAAETRNNAQWTRCGGVTLSGGDAPQNFEGACTIPASTGDVPLEVTGIAALAFICDPATGCVSTPESGRIRHSGDAHRVFGFEANPSIFIEPSEASGASGECKRFDARVVDRTGQAIPDANVDVHISGPNDEVTFCDVEGGSERRAPDRAGHGASPTQDNEGIHQEEGGDTIHTEGETGAGGRFIFGITSPVKGDTRLVAWVDPNDNDENDSGEKSATGVMHWDGGGGGSGRPACTITGDSGNNTLRGTSGDDVICGFGGKDTIRGRGGNDIIRGGKGHDDLRGNTGDDKIYGGGGLDVIRGGAGHDVLRGNSQDDVIRGYIGNDKLIGGGGDDTLRGGRGRDVLRGKTGNDTLNGGRGFDRCSGGRGRDVTRNCER